MQKIVLRFVDLIRPDPAVQDVMAFTGGGNTGFVYIGLKPLDERKISSSERHQPAAPQADVRPGRLGFSQPGQDLRIGGRASAAGYQYTIQSENVQDLVKWGPILLQNMKKLPGFTDVNSDQQNDGLQASLDYDRDTAARLGITPQLMDSTLYDGFGQSLVSTMYTSLNQYYVVHGGGAAILAKPAGIERHLYQALDRDRSPAQRRGAHFETDYSASFGESPGTISMRHGFLQSRERSAL